ncbi:DNA-binding transcriptional regulator, AcrR family [Amycolatopsis arida]|uniref:DNA-binding transcriptional regulator, AcrR family n=1 Tax=Amycolatopsis arida TaxID=587909 RepID=A0A1I5MER2_9PSEU|nr:TetR/AcrR family transcriptional regulator [Amycolatopsis arida]TDX94068.1 AcrR family transcriptional regulator [Amycolatopsis arida]SFP08013.1 DNA-binding transcriptional regulator, AcrR family [Amycolatopsis arida]
MPRGVAIPAIRQQLFAAVDEVIVRVGPGRLSGRAVTSAAGVATGLLYAHFADLDDFLAAYAVDRSFVVSASAATLPERAGSGTVAGNLCDTVHATPLPTVLALTRLLVSRPELVDRVRAVLGDRAAGLDAIESAASEYLARERRLGRVTTSAEPEALATALVGVLHRLVLTAGTESDVHDRVRRTVTALVAGVTTATPHQ